MSWFGLALALLLSALATGSRSPAATQPGLAYRVFGSPAFERPKDQGAVPDLDPMDRGDSDWAVRFTGCLTAPKSGRYAFRAEADTGLRLRVAGKTVIDGWSREGARSGRTTLAGGQAVPLLLEYYFDRGQEGKAALHLFWTPPAGSVWTGEIGYPCWGA